MAQPKSPRQQGENRSVIQLSAGLTFRRVKVQQSQETAVFPDKPYGEINMKDLQQLAKARDMKGFWKMSRESLVALHTQYDKDHPHPSDRKNPSRPKPATSRSKAKLTEPPVPTNKEKPPALPPGKDNTVPDPQPVKPDAGKFQNDLDEIVTKYKNGTEDTFSVELARDKISALNADFVNSLAGDSNMQMGAASMAAAANAKLSEVRIQRIQAASANAAKGPAPTPPPPPPSGGGGTGGGGNNNGADDRHASNRGNLWPLAGAILLGVIVAILVVVLLSLLNDDDAKADDGDEPGGAAATATPNVAPTAPSNPTVAPTQSGSGTGSGAFDPAKFPKSPAEASALFGGTPDRWELNPNGGWHLREEARATPINPNGFLGEGYFDTKPGTDAECFVFAGRTNVQGATIWNVNPTNEEKNILVAKQDPAKWDDGVLHECYVLD